MPSVILLQSMYHETMELDHVMLTPLHPLGIRSSSRNTVYCAAIVLKTESTLTQSGKSPRTLFRASLRAPDYGVLSMQIYGPPLAQYSNKLNNHTSLQSDSLIKPPSRNGRPRIRPDNRRRLRHRQSVRHRIRTRRRRRRSLARPQPRRPRRRQNPYRRPPPRSPRPPVPNQTLHRRRDGRNPSRRHRPSRRPRLGPTRLRRQRRRHRLQARRRRRLRPHGRLVPRPRRQPQRPRGRPPRRCRCPARPVRIASA